MAPLVQSCCFKFNTRTGSMLIGALLFIFALIFLLVSPLPHYIYQDSKLLASLMQWYIRFLPGWSGVEIKCTVLDSDEPQVSWKLEHRKHFIHLQGLGSSQIADHFINEIDHCPCYVSAKQTTCAKRLLFLYILCTMTSLSSSQIQPKTVYCVQKLFTVKRSANIVTKISSAYTLQLCNICCQSARGVFLVHYSLKGLYPLN